MTAHSRKEFAESRAAISEPGQNNADHAGAEKHGGKHQDARHFWHGLATQEVRRGDKQRASPGYGERQRKVTGDGVALQESFALEGIAHGLIIFQGLRYCLVRNLLASGSFGNCSSSRFQRSLRPSLKARLATSGALVERLVVWKSV